MPAARSYKELHAVAFFLGLAGSVISTLMTLLYYLFRAGLLGGRRD